MQHLVLRLQRNRNGWYLHIHLFLLDLNTTVCINGQYESCMSHSQHPRLSTSCFPKVHLIRVPQLLTKATHISHGHQITNDITN